GAGGVGAYFGGRLAQAGADVHLLARGAHLRALLERGLRVRSANGNLELRLPATDRIEDIGPADYVLVCVKSLETESVAVQMRPLLHAGTTVISLQNGVDNEEKLARVLGPRRVVGGVAFIMSTISEPGTIEHVGPLARIVFGEMDGSRSDRTERFLSLCKEAQIDAEVSSDIRSVLWNKFGFICALAGMTATVRLPLGEIRASREALEMAKNIVREVMAVAAAEGVTLPSDTVDKTVALAMMMDPGIYSSLHYDMTQGKPMELEALHGTAVRLARKHGINAPMCEAVYAILKPWAIRNAKPRA
ncbi:MAG: ketopantoate reductase family protein, partial [Vicinamibacteria bacterium]